MSESCTGSCSSCASHCNDKLNQKLAKIKHRLFVLSGKGGVGKSTVAASLAISLSKQGLKVGLLDLDFHGPSQPTLFNLQHIRLQGTDSGLIPADAAGVKLVSIGLLLENENDAIIWRGPAKLGVLKQLLEESNFGDLDYLICDFPPGTGDEILSACQLIEGEKSAIVVTTPQELSLADCRKCLDFCQKVELPVLGIIENMSYFTCSDCHCRHNLFSSGGGARMAAQSNIKLLGQLPLDPIFLDACDHGNIADGLAKSDVGTVMQLVAEELIQKLQ